MKRNRFFVALFSIVALVLIVFGVGHGLMRHVETKPGQRQNSELLFIEPGWSVRQVARTAQKLGLVSEAWQLRLISKWRGLDRAFYAGEYEILPSDSLADFLEKVLKHQTFMRRLVVPEGTSAKELEAILQTSFGLDMSDFTLPKEGDVLPETYFYERSDTAGNVVQRMIEAQRTVFAELWAARAPDLPYRSMEEAIILASIVEKETGEPGERTQVAAVFVNRLKRNMRLQSDPTVIYGITKGLPLGRPISRADLRQDTPYNTYRRSGLPPTPISNPGVGSFAAAINPASVAYLYFVADGSGGHAFAETLDEHNKNVARWRQLQKGSR